MTSSKHTPSGMAPTWLVRLPLAVREGLCEWIVGLVVGAIVALVLVGALMPAFPQIQEFSRDYGLMVRLKWEQLSSAGQGGVSLSPSTERDGRAERFAYTFLNIDDPHERPEGLRGVPALASTVAACRAESGRVPCDPRYPVSRELLGRVVEKLSTHQPAAIVVDVLLDKSVEIGTDPGEVQLRGALQQVNVPLILATSVTETSPASTTRFGWAGLPQDGAPHFPNARLGVPFPDADVPVRRFARCFESDPKMLESLPFAAASAIGAVSGCGSPGPSPRIAYTLPSLDGPADATADTRADLAATYQQVLLRCHASELLAAPDARLCGTAKAYDKRIVVIGSAHPLRRDRHATPLGDMAGPEVVINAIRSFVLYQLPPDPSTPVKLGSKLLVLFVVSLVTWLPMYIVLAKMNARDADAGVARTLSRWTLRLLVFASATALAIGLTLWWTSVRSPSPDVDLLIPVLAIGVELLAEMLVTVHRWVGDRLKSWFGVQG